jgi:glycosyltransferase involved in cell wall biosynthesis
MDISIVIIWRKDRGFLKEAIDSAEAQDFKGDWEIVLQQGELTMAQNTNAGARRAKGEYVKWLHDDDILLPTCLTDLWEARGADVIFANAFNFYPDGSGQVTRSRQPRELWDIAENNPIHAGTLMYKTKTLVDNPVDESLWTCEEYELNMRLFKLGYKFVYVNKLVSKYRVHPAMKSYSAYTDTSNDKLFSRQQEFLRIQELYM